MEALNRLADNSDNWQPRKTRYEPCLSVPPTRITRPLLLASPTAFSTPNERTNEHLLFVRAKRFLRHLKLAGRGLPSMMVQSWTRKKRKKEEEEEEEEESFSNGIEEGLRNFFLSFANATRVSLLYAGSWWIAF